MAKKSFIDKDTPEKFFISKESIEKVDGPTEPAKAAPTPANQEPSSIYYKPVEKKSRRVQLVLQPSLYDRVKQAASGAGTSVNTFIIEAIEEKIEGSVL